MSRDIVPVQGGDIDSARAALQAPGPVTWRRLHLRFGWFELSYASLRRKAEKPAPQAVPRLSGPPARFRHRFLGATGLVLASALFLIVAGSLWSMSSSAVVMRTIYNWPITQEGAQVAGERPRAAPASHAASPVALRAPIAAVAIATKPARAGVDQEDEGPSSPLVFAPDLSHLEHIPAVRSAIAQAYASGQMQNWQAGTLEGVVVIGPEVDGNNGMICRRGTILARDGSFTGRTQPFERCGRS